MSRLAPIVVACALLAWPLARSAAQEPAEVETPAVEPQAPEAAPAAAEGADAELPPAATARDLLDAIHADLVQLRFEKALAALEPLLTRPGLTEDERIEALVLRSQTHAAFGDFKSAEDDYRQILLRRPGWSPDRSLTPSKAMQRFESVRDGLVGRVRFVLDPADATLWIDGREQFETLDPLPLLAGTHAVRAARRGHDLLEQTLEVAAGASVEVELSLVPNARTVILRTEPADVEVLVDGRVVGRTSREEGFLGVGQAPAQLVLEDMPLGEHTFEFRKECRRTEKIVDALNVDLLDRAPKRYPTVRLAESFVRLAPTGGPRGTELRVDGRAVSRLPSDPVPVCPGERVVQAWYEDRILWMRRIQLVEGAPQDIEIRPRPNLVLIGLERIPRELGGLAAAVNVLRSSEAAPGADFSRAATWHQMRLEAGVDLALAPAAGSGRGAGSTWWLYSPVLRTVHRLAEAPDTTQPEWRTPTWGLTVVDAGGPLVVEQFASAADGPGVGSRILSAGGETLAGTDDWRAQLAAATPRGSIGLIWQRPDGTRAEGTLRAVRGPWLRDRGKRGVEDAFRAAWAVVAAASGDADGSAALANLALLFGTYGEHDLAVSTWRRIDWPERNGIGAGTIAYYLGRDLQSLGRDREAAESLRRAAKSAGRAGTEQGPPVAPAARDRLADLGQSP